MVLHLARLARRSLGVVGLLIAAWLVLLGLRVLRTAEGGDTWLLVAGLAWRGAALPTVRAAARGRGRHGTDAAAWAGVLGISGLGYAMVGPRHGDLAVVWIHPVVYPAGARYPRMCGG